MTIKTRALLAALALTISPMALSAAYAQDERQMNEGGDGNRFQRRAEPKAQAPGTLSSAVRGPLANAQTAMAAKKWPEAIAASKEALAAAKSDYEVFTSNQILTNVYISMGDQAGAVAPAEAAADVPTAAIPAEYRQSTYYLATALALNAKHNEKALTYAKALQSINATDARSQEVIGRALYANGDAGAVAFFQKQVDTAVAAGKAPDRDALQMLKNAQIKAKDQTGAAKTMVQSVTYYPDKDDWALLIDVTIGTTGTRDIDFVMAGRLLMASGATVSKEDADLFGQTTQKMAIYGDALAAQAKGATLQLDNARIAEDKASLPAQIPMGAAQNGLFNIKLAEALYGYGNYAQAEAVARTAQSKGGIDASEATMLIGISQVMQGKYADGIATLGNVQGGGPVTPRIAELWVAYAKNKGGLVPGGQTASR